MNGTKWCSHKENISISLTTTISSWFSSKMASFSTSKKIYKEYNNKGLNKADRRWRKIKMTAVTKRVLKKWQEKEAQSHQMSRKWQRRERKDSGKRHAKRDNSLTKLVYPPRTISIASCGNLVSRKLDAQRPAQKKFFCHELNRQSRSTIRDHFV